MTKNHGKNAPALTYREIVESEQKKLNSKAYKIEVSEHALARNRDLVGKTADELLDTATAEPVSLKDLGDVKSRTVVYVKACGAAGTLPNIAGLCVALGLSRSAFYDCLSNRRPAETAEWLSLVRDAFSDIAWQASLRGDVQPIVTIFQQKAMYNWRESLEIVATTTNPVGEDVDEATLQNRILGSIPPEDDF